MNEEFINGLFWGSLITAALISSYFQVKEEKKAVVTREDIGSILGYAMLLIPCIAIVVGPIVGIVVLVVVGIDWLIK